MTGRQRDVTLAYVLLDLDTRVIVGEARNLQGLSLKQVITDLGRQRAIATAGKIRSSSFIAHSLAGTRLGCCVHAASRFATAEDKSITNTRVKVLQKGAERVHRPTDPLAAAHQSRAIE
jgi:hypothetical protein